MSFKLQQVLINCDEDDRGLMVFERDCPQNNHTKLASSKEITNKKKKS